MELEVFTSLPIDNDKADELSDLAKENPDELLDEEDKGKPNPDFTVSVEGFEIASNVFTELVELNEKLDLIPAADGASPPARAGVEGLLDDAVALEIVDPKLKPPESDDDEATVICFDTFELKLIDDRGDEAAVILAVEEVIERIDVDAATKPDPEEALIADVTGFAMVSDLS